MNNANRILNDKNLLDIIYSIEGYYYYNQQAFIELINDGAKIDIAPQKPTGGTDI
jgi:hypothetical protein